MYFSFTKRTNPHNNEIVIETIKMYTIKNNAKKVILLHDNRFKGALQSLLRPFRPLHKEWPTHKLKNVSSFRTKE